MFWLILTTLLYIKKKNYTNIAFTDFVNVNIALNLQFFWRKLEFYNRIRKKDVSFVAL